MTLEVLKERREKLQADRAILVSKIAVYDGALEENQYWITEAEKEQADGGQTKED